MRHLLLIALLTAAPLGLEAQHVSPARLPARAGIPHSHHRGNFSRGYYPVAYFDPFAWDYMDSLDDSVPAQPPVIVLPAPPAAPELPPPPAHPLLIELQGDRYVEVSEENQLSARWIEQPSPPALPSQSLTRASWPQDALLIFRDGHREQVSGYTISNGFLYATANYYTEGTWNRKIDLSSLNVPATVSANQSRGIDFRLPTASNEVIVGP
jgi:hypothetical protein